MHKKHDIWIFFDTLRKQRELIITFFIVMMSSAYETVTFR